MTIAILKDGVCIDAAQFQSLQTAQRFLESGVWPQADGVTGLPDGFKIGDFYDGQNWTRAPEPPPDPGPEPEPQPDYMAFLEGLMEGYGNE